VRKVPACRIGLDAHAFELTDALSDSIGLLGGQKLG
jgi:hypothetical protein